ncbi:MAG: class I SAM-dependent methyltransferase [Pseudomonadales bacterium]|nr:MAG: class I SAM-dependent methyltransferase [Pseudomonadales bacterium]
MTNNKHEAVRERIKNQYEKFPYPDGEKDFSAPLKQGILEGCPKHHFDWYWPTVKKTEKLNILVAGCGTGTVAKMAVHVPKANLIGIDISDESLKRSKKLLKHNKIKNVRLMNMPIEDVHKLGMKFDLVQCTGVLHHLASPDEGLSALKGVLKDSGSMYLMVYAAYGRNAIYIMQDFFRRAGISVDNLDDQGIDHIRTLLQSAPPDSAVSLQRQIFKNYDLDPIEIVDLFLNPQDRPYTLPDIHSWLERNGLVMQKLINRALYAPRCSNLAKQPIYENIAKLPEQEQLIIGELYRSSIFMHTFIACSDSRPRSSWEISFEGDNWKKLIPIKQFMIQKQPGSSSSNAIERWRLDLHQSADIFLDFDEQMLCLANEIDDSSTLHEIYQKVASDNPYGIELEYFIRFFSLLYDYDYIWFRKQKS